MWVKLTDTAWHEINKVAQQQGISASELIERWGRGLKSPTASSHPCSALAVPEG